MVRQGSFVKKMVDLSWTAAGRFSGADGDPNSVHVLVRCISRYHAFLDLMSANVEFYVPTLVSPLSADRIMAGSTDASIGY